MELQSTSGITVEVQQIAKGMPIFDNPINNPATLIVDFASYSAKFAFNEKSEMFRIHIEMFVEFNPDLSAPIEIKISPNIQTAKFIEFSQSMIDEVSQFAHQLQSFYIKHFFQNNAEQVVYNTIVETIKSCNNPIYSIFYYERDFNVLLDGEEFFLRHKA